MKFLELTKLLFCSLIFVNYSSAQSWEWAKRGFGHNSNSGQAIAVDTDGNSYVTGKFSSNYSFDGTELTNVGNWDIFVIKYDSIGNLVWAKGAGSSNEDEGLGIAIDNDNNIFITGYFTGTINFDDIQLTAISWTTFTAKLDSDGNYLWVKKVEGTGYNKGFGIATDGDGSCYVIGNFTGNANFDGVNYNGSGLSDIFIVKYDSEGDVVWVNQSSSEGSDFGNAIAVNNSGEVFITGRFFGPSVIAGEVLTTTGLYDIFVAKYSASGASIWAESFGGNAHDAGHGISVDASGNCYVTGEFKGTATFGSFSLSSESIFADPREEIFVIKMDNDGNVVWANSAGGNNSDFGYAIQTDYSGNSTITGVYRSLTATFANQTLSSLGGTDVFVSKYDNNGNLLWVKKAGSSVDDLSLGIDLDAVGNAYITGQFGGTDCMFGNISMGSSQGASHVFTAKLDINGTDVSNVASSDLPKFSIYPNPTTDILNVFKPDEQIYSLQIKNSLGQTIYFCKLNDQITAINLGVHFSQGLYFLILTDSHENLIGHYKIMITE